MISHEIIGDDMQAVILTLAAGDEVRAEAGVGPSPDSLPQALLGWVLGVAFVYSALFGTGSFLYGRSTLALFWLVIFVVSGIGLWRVVPGMWRVPQASQSA